MSKVYNIMDKLVNEKPILQLAEDKTFTINNSKNTAIMIKLAYESDKLDDFQKMDRVIELAIGEAGLEYVNSLELPVEGCAYIVTAIMAAISGEELETIEDMVEDKKDEAPKK